MDVVDSAVGSFDQHLGQDELLTTKDDTVLADNTNDGSKGQENGGFRESWKDRNYCLDVCERGKFIYSLFSMALLA